MTVFCRGWQHPHDCDGLVDIELAYWGALQFPSRYSVCVDCLAKVQAFVDRMRVEHGPYAVRFSVTDLITGLRETR